MDLSLIIPVHSAEGKIDLLLDALGRISLQKIKAEILFVADRCKKQTISRINAWCRLKGDWYQAICVEADVGNSDLARGIGVKRAKGRFLAFLDDDCLPSKMWVVKGLELAEKYGAVTGKVQHGNSFLQNLCAVMDFGEFQAHFPEQKDNAPGCNLIFKADLMEEFYMKVLPSDCNHRLSKFVVADENEHAPAMPVIKAVIKGYPVLKGLNYGGDRILASKLASLLGGIHYNPELVVFHDPDLTLPLVWKREKRYGEVAWQVRRENFDIKWSCILKTGFFAPFILVAGRFVIDLKRVFQMTNCSIIRRSALGVSLVPFRIAWFIGVRS